MHLPIEILVRLRLASEKEWNKMSEEFILNAYKSFRRLVDALIEKMVAILNKLSVLRLSYFIVFFFFFN